MESFRVLAKYRNELTPKSERFDTAKQRHRIFFARNKMQENSINHCRTQFSGNFCRGFDFPIRQPSAHKIQLQYTNLCSETGSSNPLTFATSSTALCNRVRPIPPPAHNIDLFNHHASHWMTHPFFNQAINVIFFWPESIIPGHIWSLGFRNHLRQQLGPLTWRRELVRTRMSLKC